jgi:hypothetical protein
MISNLEVLGAFERKYLIVLFQTTAKYSKKNLRGNWHEEEDL